MATIPGTTTHNYLTRLSAYARTHKVISVIVIIVILVAVYEWYGATHGTSTATQYTLGTVTTGTVISTVSGSGQVSPLNQITINPQVSGTVTKVLVQEGQSVTAGQAIAYLDATDEYNAVQSAQASLESAQLSLQKLQEPATQLSLAQDQDEISKAQESQQSAQTNLTQAYATNYSDIVATYLDLPAIMAGIEYIDIGTEASKGSEWNIDYYKSATLNWDPLASTYDTTAYTDYTTALTAYNSALADYQLTDQTSSTSTIDSISTETYSMSQSVADALNSANSFIQFYEDQIKGHNQVPSSEADSSLTDLNTYIGKMTTHFSTLLGDQNAIQSDIQTIADDQRTIDEDQLTLQQLQAGPDPLDLQSSQLAVQQQQNALTQAQTALDDYTIRAPITGTIATLSLNVGDAVSSGTSAAVEITTQQIADLSLDEVDAAKVSAGQQVTLTFDAIPNLTLTGTVTSVSPLGTVTQGVVSYTVEIATNTQDPRVKAGMSVDADIQTAVHQNVLVVPSSAIKTVGTANYVQVFNPALPNAAGSTVTPTQIPQSIPVTLGISDDTNTEITSGLTAGEQIVTKTSGGNTTTKTAAATATTRGGFGGGGGGGGGGAVLRGL